MHLCEFQVTKTFLMKIYHLLVGFVNKYNLIIHSKFVLISDCHLFCRMSALLEDMLQSTYVQAVQ